MTDKMAWAALTTACTLLGACRTEMLLDTAGLETDYARSTCLAWSLRSGLSAGELVPVQTSAKLLQEPELSFVLADQVYDAELDWLTCPQTPACQVRYQVTGSGSEVDSQAWFAWSLDLELLESSCPQEGLSMLDQPAEQLASWLWDVTVDQANDELAAWLEESAASGRIDLAQDDGEYYFGAGAYLAGELPTESSQTHYGQAWAMDAEGGTQQSSRLTTEDLASGADAYLELDPWKWLVLSDANSPF